MLVIPVGLWKVNLQEKVPSSEKTADKELEREIKNNQITETEALLTRPVTLSKVLYVSSNILS